MSVETFTLVALLLIPQLSVNKNKKLTLLIYMSFVFTMSYAVAVLKGYTLLFNSLMNFVISVFNEGKSLVHVSQTNDALVVI